jgi:hypothetical protein
VNLQGATLSFVCARGLENPAQTTGGYPARSKVHAPHVTQKRADLQSFFMPRPSVSAGLARDRAQSVRAWHGKAIADRPRISYHPPMRESDQIDPEAIVDFAVEAIKSATTSAGHRLPHARLSSMKFFLGPQFSGMCDALDISDGTRQRILALVRERSISVKERYSG